jgi:hypothetical protein
LEPSFPAVAQPPMRSEHPVAGASVVIDNRTDLPDSQIREVVRDQWTEIAGLQMGHPNNFQLYANNQGSMLARTPFRTPSSVIDEIRLARSVADTDDDIGAIIGQMNAIAFGDGLVNQHRDEKTLEFFNQITKPTGMDLPSVMEEMYRELLISSSVTTLTVFSRKRMQYWPLKSDTPIQAQLQVPNVAVLPAENLRVITNDIMHSGQLAYFVEDPSLRNWLNEYLDENTKASRKAYMAMQEPVVAALFTGKYRVPMNDGDITSRGQTLYTLNQAMVKRTTMPKGTQPYPRPLLTRNFALLEAKRLLNIMDYALLQGGTNYIVVAKKGSDNLPAQQAEVDNLVEQVRHASRSGVLVGDHRVDIEIITPTLTELLNPNKRKLIGRKLKMGLMRQSEEVPGDTGPQGSINEMELTSRVIASDRRKLISHAQATFFDDTATRNRSVFPMGAPHIWAPKIILTNVQQFWQMVLNARDRGDIPRRWVVESLGYNFDAAVAERQREIANGVDEILTPAAVPFSNPGEPQDNGPGRPPGTSPNNGSSRDLPGQGRDAAAPTRVIHRNAGETVTAFVENNEVHYVGELTRRVLEQYGETADYNGYVVQAERDAIDWNQTVRSGSSVIVPVNPNQRCQEFASVKLEEGLRMIVGRRLGDGAMVARALRFQEPRFDLKRASEYAIRWGFMVAPMVETAASSAPTCTNCGLRLDDYPTNPVCPSCGADNTQGGPAVGESSTGGVGPSLDDTAATDDLDQRVRTLAAEVQRLTVLLTGSSHAPSEWISDAKWPYEKRELAVRAGDALPGGRFPIIDQEDADFAAGHADQSTIPREQVVSHVIAMVKRHGLEMPKVLDDDINPPDRQ